MVIGIHYSQEMDQLIIDLGLEIDFFVGSRFSSQVWYEY